MTEHHNSHNVMPDAEDDRKSVHGPNKKIISAATLFIMILVIAVPESRTKLLEFTAKTSEMTTICMPWMLGFEVVITFTIIWTIIWLVTNMNRQDDEFEE